MPSYMMSYEYEIIYIGHDTCFCGSAAYILACGMYRLGIGISSCLGRLLPNGAQVVQCSVHPSRRAPPASLAPRNHGLSCSSSPGELLCSGRGFNKAVYQEMLAALGPWRPPIPWTQYWSCQTATRRSWEGYLSCLTKWPRREISCESAYSSSI